MATVGSIDQPVIARVHGIATAAGCQLVAACDLAVADAAPGSRLPASTSGCSARPRRSRSCGPSDASGPSSSCSPATDRRRHGFAWGLVNEVVAPDELDAAVRRLAERIAEADPRVIALGKRTFGAQADVDSPGLRRRQHGHDRERLVARSRGGIGKFLKR